MQIQAFSFITSAPSDCGLSRLPQMKTASIALSLLIAFMLIAFIGCAVTARAQGETTSAIGGVVNDPNGSVIVGAIVTVTNTATGFQRTVQTDDGGRFTFPQLRPGSYMVRVTASGFQEQRNDALPVPLGQTQTANFTLKIIEASERVEVSDRTPLINTENPNTTTTLTAKAIEDLPNPGSDLTYVAQFAPGAVMNTAGGSNDFVGGQSGYGNVQFNGLPALSNGYIVDGMETNDPLTNLNSGLSTNLVLGLNSIQEVTVNTTSYAVDQGRYGAAQINYVTKSGTNKFHGNLYEMWNGSTLNAANFFTNATPGGLKPHSNVNHFGGSLGGPILHNKLFFFGDFEQVRIVLPIVQSVTVPSSAFQNYVLQQLPRGGVDTITGNTYPASPVQVPFYRQIFALYGNPNGTPLPVLGCPFNADGSAAIGNPSNGNGCANRRSASFNSGDREQVVTARIDHSLNASNVAWYRFQADTGLQAAYNDPINPLFNATSPQPLYLFAAGYTHIFTQNLVNYFNPGVSWYSSIFQPPDLAKTLAAFPIVLAGDGPNAPFTQLGGLDYNWPQGRRATRVMVNDYLAWTKGNHQFRFGTNIRRLLISDLDFSTYDTPLVTYTTLPQFIYGAASLVTKSFPATQEQPFTFTNLDLFAMDTVKLTPKLTLTYGLRATHNSNPVNPQETISRPAGSFDAAPHSDNQPLNEIVQTNLRHVFPATPRIIWQPRASAAWQFSPHSVLRGGFGVFSDILPGTLADLIGSNPPTINTFQGGLFGQAGGLAIAPGVPNSAVDATIRANQSFLNGFRQGRLSCAAAGADPRACLPPVGLTAVDSKLRAPYFMQWSLGLEHQFGNTMSLRLQYVGTRAVNLPYQVQVNGYQTVCEGCFAPFPYNRPKDARFAAVNQFTTGANSNYNGLQVTAEKHLSHGLQVTANYTWSHCLDTVSNGGFLSFSSLGIISPLPGQLNRQYGSCDYDIRHNFNSFYVYELPVNLHQRLLGKLTNGWQVSGTVIMHSGLPFSVLSANYSANGNGIFQGGGPQFASIVPGQPLYRHTPIPGVTQPGTVQWLNPDAFISTVDPSTGACTGGDNPANCQFGNLGRNALRGPRFISSDLYLTKRILLTERFKMRLEGQFFNVFNHPNFALPNAVAGISGRPATQTGFGAITATTSPPTGLLGVGLGGDNSPRMIALKILLEF